MSTESEAGVTAETAVIPPAAQAAPVAAAATVIAPPSAEPPAKTGAKVEMTSDELKRRLDQTRASALADFIKGLGVTDEAALKAAVTEHKRLEDEKRTDLEKRDVRIKDLEPKAARALELEGIVKAVAEEQEAALTDAQKAVVGQLAGDDPAKRLGVIKALRSVLPAAPIAAAPQPAAPSATQQKPPIQPGANTAPPPAPSPSGVVSPHVDYLATWEALKSRPDGGYSAGLFYNRNTAAIVAAQKARS